MKPAVAGKPASDSIAMVIGQASQGAAAPRSRSDSSESPCSDTRSRAATTANAATFMNR